jgi:hypothetical protein
LFVALNRLYEGKNINRKMNLRNQLKNAERRINPRILLQNIPIHRTTRSNWRYYRRRQTYNNDPQGSHKTLGCIHPNNCARIEKLKFDSLWEECIQEETRVANREALLARNEDQALATHTKGGRNKSYFQKETYKESQPPKKFNHKESHLRRFQKK